ncbi:adenylate kinase isoenzyme 1 isoform X2 [Callorhinus ursinus]|uniref:adenylate kinase isoenzyme 1 isoform X2 n=1 Tax=Callorhinus ursinus TaxID=34884 RepID=UPI003CD03653
MGGPGCGKGTQCKNMATKYGFCHVGLGQLLRQEAQRSTQRGRKIHNIMLQGLLVPMGIILDMICNAMLSRPESRGFLIDGFLRELRQAKEFERIASSADFMRRPIHTPEQPWLERLETAEQDKRNWQIVSLQAFPELAG